MSRVFAALKNIVENGRIICANIFRPHFDGRFGFQDRRNLGNDTPGFVDASALLGLHSHTKIGCVGVWKQAEPKQRDKKEGCAGAH